MQQTSENGSFSYSNIVLTIIISVAVFVVLICIYHAVSQISISSENTKLQIYVVDTKALLQAETQRIQNEISSGREMSHEALISDGKLFATILIETINSYTERGAIVIDKTNLLGAPDTFNITPELAKSLNLKLENNNDFVAPDPASM